MVAVIAWDLSLLNRAHTRIGLLETVFCQIWSKRWALRLRDHASWLAGWLAGWLCILLMVGDLCLLRIALFPFGSVRKCRRSASADWGRRPRSAEGDGRLADCIGRTELHYLAFVPNDICIDRFSLSLSASKRRLIRNSG